jgi:hypothetical protein
MCVKSKKRDYYINHQKGGYAMKTNLKRIPIFLFLGVFMLTLLFLAPVASAGLLDDRVKVMTRNLYLGADIFKVLEAAQNPDPAKQGLDVPIAVAELFQTVQYTNFPERAEAIANEIWFHRPHLIGLQEVSTWYIQSPGDFLVLGPGGPQPNPDQEPADVVVYDYLTILLNALAARGLHYHVAVSSVVSADVELPMLTGFTTIPGYPTPVPTFDDLRLVDHDVILVRGDVDAWNTTAAPYGTNVSETIAGATLEFTRGWVAADVDVCGETYRFVSTHLEVRSDPQSPFRVVQAAQMQELLTVLSDETKPLILVGDFNSSPDDVPGTGYVPDGQGGYIPVDYVPPYMQATMYAGYLDAWDLIFFPRDGFTSGFDEYVSDPTAELTSRIDLVLLNPQDEAIKRVTAITTGDNAFNMTPSGLWPSDHAGVVARIVFDD